MNPEGLMADSPAFWLVILSLGLLLLGVLVLNKWLHFLDEAKE